jgi:hypothetical protein
MEYDHGGPGPPTVNAKPRCTMSTLLAQSARALLKKIRESSEKDKQQTAEISSILEKTTAKLDKLADRNNKDGCYRLTSPRTAHLTCAQKRRKMTLNAHPARAQLITPSKNSQPSPNKSRLIVSSTKFPDPKNCTIFLQPTTRENAPCWFHKESGGAASATMTQQEALERGPKRPHRLHPGASLPTTQFFALTHGATCSAEHYHAFRRPPPSRDKNQARRVPQKQAMQNNDYFKTYSKLTRGATLRKEHYQAFRKPPPTRDRKQDWIMKHHE